MIETQAHVSFGSHPQYLPQDSFAQTPPRKFPTTSIAKPMINAASLIAEMWLIDWSMFGFFGFLAMNNNKLINPKTAPNPKKP